jgi:phytoene synthase
LITVAASYAHCQKLARRAASNFYFSFLLLPREQRRAMCALYAFLRKVDDLGDCEDVDVVAAKQALEELRSKLLNGSDRDADPMLPALRDTINRFHIPTEYLTAAIDGVEMDLSGERYDTFADLEKYCYRVASVVGLSCIHIWGFRSPEALEPARRCGIAFQLTNILRDLKEDAERNRVYLPSEDWQRFGYTIEDVRHGIADDRFSAFMGFQIERAKTFYEAATKLDPLLLPGGRRAFRAMWQTYRRLLDRIEQRPAEVVRRRIRLSKWEKCGIALRAIFGRNALLEKRESVQGVSSRETAAS